MGEDFDESIICAGADCLEDSPEVQGVWNICVNVRGFVLDGESLFCRHRFETEGSYNMKRRILKGHRFQKIYNTL